MDAFPGVVAGSLKQSSDIDLSAVDPHPELKKPAVLLQPKTAVLPATTKQHLLMQAEPALLPFCQRAESFAGLQESGTFCVTRDVDVDEPSGFCSCLFPGNCSAKRGNCRDATEMWISLKV